MIGHSFERIQAKAPALSASPLRGRDGGQRRGRLSAAPSRDAEMALHPSLLLRDILAAASRPAASHRTASPQPSMRLETWPVRGALLRDSLLAPGDSLMLQPGAHVAPGELALVRVGRRSEALLRRVYPEGSQLRLVPEDSRFAVELRSGDAVEILGRVLSVVRPARAESQAQLAI